MADAKTDLVGWHPFVADLKYNHAMIRLAMRNVSAEVFEHFKRHGHAPVPMNPATWRGGISDFRVRSFGAYND